MLLSFLLHCRAAVPRGASAPPGPELGPPLARVVAGQDDLGYRRRDARLRELGRDRCHVVGPIPTRRRGRERSRLLDQPRVVLQPPALIEGDGGDDAAPTTVGGGEASAP